ncbi:MAG: hypothetical protein KatS3mg076_1163 [Candidatus Binatia bacterium]|nr:MAG: hypothetical protein KatS3mg076_1163 [Candidatus Binatia bacterium]
MVQASPEECFATICDFSAYPKWATGVRRTHVRELDGEGRPKLVEFELEIPLRTVRYVLEYSYEPPRRLRWRSVEGDVDSIEGEYVFDPEPDGSTRATCRQAVSLGFWIPGFLRERLEKEALKRSVLEFRQEAERRKRRARSKKKSTGKA